MSQLNSQTKNTQGDTSLKTMLENKNIDCTACKTTHEDNDILPQENTLLNEKKQWFAIRVTYSRELKFKNYLDQLGVDNFIPMVFNEIERKGRIQKELLPAVHNLVFVHITAAHMEELRKDPNLVIPIHYIRDYASQSPVIVPDKQMRDFMQVAQQHNPDNLFLSTKDVALRKGDKVRVLSGPFKGIIGTFVRIKRNRRVVVDIPGVMAIASAFVHPNDVEIIEKKD
ncbi:MAG TPA: UpxY family transcription antiterminator [Bacteroidaceae bacterium]|mgnify:CR=1 FL=1|nr:UpxY family transcription antiterminator [Bacteroidaceae bacterium]